MGTRCGGPVGSIASSAITGIVFHTSVSDSGVRLIAWIMAGVTSVLVLISVLDRILPGKAGSWPRFRPALQKGGGVTGERTVAGLPPAR